MVISACLNQDLNDQTHNQIGAFSKISVTSPKSLHDGARSGKLIVSSKTPKGGSDEQGKVHAHGSRGATHSGPPLIEQHPASDPAVLLHHRAG